MTTSPISQYLQEVLEATVDGGEVASYIPELAHADPDRLAAAICTADGMQYATGDVEARFSIQSISKPFVYALACQELGIDEVLKSVGVEPSGDFFNSASLDPETKRPDNPMINIGAITTHALIAREAGPEERFERIRAGLSAFAGRELAADEKVFDSEMRTAFRNFALAYLVRSVDGFTQDPTEIVTGYTRQCSLLVDVRDLSVMAMTLAHGGVNPVTGRRVVDDAVAQQVLSVMTTCGMYNASGDWVTQVGIPAKSGVAGGIIGALPGQAGAAVFSPRLDEVGNSVRGVQAFETFSRELGLHLLSTPPLSKEAVRSVSVEDTTQGKAHVLALQGPLRFSSAEHVLRVLGALPDDGLALALDLTRVASIDRASERMLMLGMRQAAQAGHTVCLVDPRERSGEGTDLPLHLATMAEVVEALRGRAGAAAR